MSLEPRPVKLSDFAPFDHTGAASSAAGQALTLSLIELRRRGTGKAPSVELAPVGETAAAFAMFMAGSSNPHAPHGRNGWPRSCWPSPPSPFAFGGSGLPSALASQRPITA